MALAILALAFDLSAEMACDPADEAYGGVSFLPLRYMEWPSPESAVLGLRLNVISGRHDAVTGLDVGTIVNYTDSGLRGVAFSLVNSHGEAYGLQTGLVNATGFGCGVQIGFWNMAEDYRGLQIGVGNFAYRLCGVQIGLGDIIAESPFPTCVILNACF